MPNRWGDILSTDALFFLISVGAGDAVSTQNFFTFLETDVNVNDFIRALGEWNALSETEQIGKAIDMVGENHASRFLALLDFYSEDDN